MEKSFKVKKPSGKKVWKCFKGTLIIHKSYLQKEWGLQLKGEAQSLFLYKGVGSYTYMEAQKFLRYEKDYGTYTHMEAQVFLKIEIETSCHL